MPLKTQETNYKLAELRTRNNDLSKRWYIEYFATEEGSGELIRKQKFCPVKYKSAKERKEWAKDYISVINAALIAGYVLPNPFDEEQPIPKEVESDKTIKLLLDGIDYAISVKLYETRTRTGHAFNSFRNS